jgi:hypothetical protein
MTGPTIKFPCGHTVSVEERNKLDPFRCPVCIRNEISPFNSAGRQWAWDSVSLNWLKDCPRKYKYFMLDGWAPKEESVHIRFGLLYAKALEGYHSTLAREGDHKAALYDVVRWALIASYPWEFSDPNKTRETLIRSIIWYLDKYENDPTKTVILEDGRPAVELATRFQLDNDNLIVVHLDRIVEFSGQTYIQDQKTTKSTISGYYFDGYSMDNQMSLYSAVGQVVYKSPIAGVMIDAAQIAVGFTKHERGFTYRTREQLDEWLNDTRYYIGPYRDVAEVANWPQNDTACNKFRSDDPHRSAHGCPLREVCGKDPRVREKFLETNFVKRRWNPLADRT